MYQKRHTKKETASCSYMYRKSLRKLVLVIALERELDGKKTFFGNIYPLTVFEHFSMLISISK